MKTLQTWGWLAAGVLAAGLNASYHDGGLEWAHRVADTVSDHVEEVSTMMHDLASGRADMFLTEARLFLNRNNEDSSSRLATTLARVETRVAPKQTECREEERAKVMSARRQAAMDRAEARMEANRDRLEAARERAEAKMESERDRIEVRIAQLHIPANLTTVSFAPMPPACPRINVRLPRMPKIMIPAPPIHVSVPGADPI